MLTSHRSWTKPHGQMNIKIQFITPQISQQRVIERIHWRLTISTLGIPFEQQTTSPELHNTIRDIINSWLRECSRFTQIEVFRNLVINWQPGRPAKIENKTALVQVRFRNRIQWRATWPEKGPVQMDRTPNQTQDLMTDSYQQQT